MARPAGTPSTIATSEGPCDSPAVKNRSISPLILSELFPGSGPRRGRFRMIHAGRSLAPRVATAEDAMELFADRFVIGERGLAIDLSTGRRVALRRFDDADGIHRSDQIRWSLRCDEWLGIHHRSVARLIDYGLAGRSTRFEAWDCESPWEGSDHEASRTRALATRFLAAAGLTAGAAMTIHARDGVAVAVPGDDDGYECAGEIEAETPIAVRGLRRIARGAVTALAELF